MGEGIGMYRVLAGKSEGNRPLGRLRRRWEDNTGCFKKRFTNSITIEFVKLFLKHPILRWIFRK
jgi:hypothetical protein